MSTNRSVRRHRLLIGAVAAAIGLSGVLAVPAQAVPADEQLVSANPDDHTPRVLDGQVEAIVRIGDTIIVGGNFTRVREAPTNAPELTRTGLFAFSRSTGVIDPNFNPVLGTGDPLKKAAVRALAVSADGTGVYVGGEYRTINGSGPARLQQVSLSDGQRVGSFGNSAFNKSVMDLKLVGDRLYVAGAFTQVGGVARGGLATLDPLTGALTTAATTSFSGIVNGGVTTVRKIDVTPSGDRLIAIGNFMTVAGQARAQVAMLDTSGASATVASWSTPNFPRGCSSSFDTYLRDVDFAPDGSFFVIVTTGGWGGTGTTCDAATRYETYRTGSQNFSWIDFTGGDTFWSVEVTATVAYVGGHFRWLNNPYGNGDSAGAGAVARPGIAALDIRNGLPFSWNPGRARGVGVFDFLVTPNELWAGSDTNTWAGERRERLAAFPFAGGSTLPTDKLGSLPGDVIMLDSDAVAGVDTRSRYLTGAAAPTTTALTASEDWSKVRGSVMIDNQVYTGWSDGTFKSRTFDGNTFGAPTNIPLNGIGLAQDLPNVKSMFFDRRDGRLYYTLPNTSKGNKPSNGGLYYRYFTPESGVVGAVRWDQSRVASEAAISASTIRGSFLVGDQLHFIDQNGVMKKITFNNGQFSGSATTVNSTDWRARGVFASTQPSILAPNNAPTADFTFDCVGLSCTFNGGPSTDGDGTITQYDWEFGDGTGPGATQQTGHVFGSAGDYAVTLTVTDNDGATDDITKQVSVAPIASNIEFRTSDQYTGGPTKLHSWNVPAGVQAGDTMVLAVTGHTAADPGDPVGWTRQSDVLDTDTRTVIFTRTATETDAGSPISLTWTTDGVTELATRTTMSLAAYSGVASVGSVAGGPELSQAIVNAHTTPDVTVPADGAWVVSYWSDKTFATTGWNAPASQQVRANPTSLRPVDALDTVRVTGLLTDDGAPTVTGVRAGLTATADSPANKGTKFSIVLVSE